MIRGHRYAGALVTRDRARHLKLAQILPEANLPVARAPQAAVSSSGGYGALAKFGATLQQSAAEFAVVQERIAKAEDAKRKAFGRQEGQAAKSLLEGSVTQLETSLSTEADPDAYVTTIAESVQRFRTEIAGSLTTEEGRAAFAHESEKLMPGIIAKAGIHANGLYQKRSAGVRDNDLAERLTLVGRTSPADDAAHARHLSEAKATIDADPFLLPEERAKKLREFEQDQLEIRAKTEIGTNPQGFMERLETQYARLHATKREGLKNAARERIVANRKAENAAADRYYKWLDTQLDAANQQARIDLMERAMTGQATVVDLASAKQAGIFENETQYATFHKAVTDIRETASDPATLQRVDLAVRRVVPTMTEGQIDALYRAGKLNRTHWKDAKDKLVGRLTDLRDLRRADDNRAHSQAEQMLMLAVGKSSIDNYDDEDGQLFAVAVRDLTTRSNAFPQYGGKENPLAVAQELIDKHITPARAPRLRLTIDTIRQQLAFPAQTSTDAQARLNAKRSTLSPAQIASEENKLVKMFRAEQQLADTKGGKANPQQQMKKPGALSGGGKAEDQ